MNDTGPGEKSGSLPSHVPGAAGVEESRGEGEVQDNLGGGAGVLNRDWESMHGQTPGQHRDDGHSRGQCGAPQAQGRARRCPVCRAADVPRPWDGETPRGLPGCFLGFTEHGNVLLTLRPSGWPRPS